MTDVLDLLARLGRRDLAPVIEVQDRLTALGFPFGSGAGLDPNSWGRDAAMVREWAVRMLDEQRIARTAQSEQLARGATPLQIATTTGISTLRVFHHLAKAPDEWTAERDRWRVVRAPESPPLDGMESA